MIYEFIDDDGELIEADFPMKRAPKIGGVYTVTNRAGKLVQATRIISVPAAVAGDNWQPYASDRLPRNLPGCKHTPKGKPIIESRQQEREIAARHGYIRE